MIIDGKKIGREIIDRLKSEPQQRGFFAVILVGENTASERFVQQKEVIAKELNIDFRIYRFPGLISKKELRKRVGVITRGSICHGAIVQLPLPSHIDRRTIINVIPKEKDVDVLSEKAYSAFLSGVGLIPPSVATFVEVLSHHQLLKDVSHETKLTFAVVGHGFLIGKPIADYLHIRGERVIVFDKGDDFNAIKNADVIVLGVGVPHLINSDVVKSGALIVDFGCSFVNGKLCGDFESTKNGHCFYTPTPGGTGPILVAKLFENYLK